MVTKKNKTLFVCQECGHETTKWAGQCICGAWNSYIEEKVLPPLQNNKNSNPYKDKNSSKPIFIGNVEENFTTKRIDTGINELNRVLGGGIVPGSLTLISGEPGIGKSTIIMQAANNISFQGKKLLYVSGEESSQQLKLRWKRICHNESKNFLVVSETNMEVIQSLVEDIKADFLILDSIQTVYSSQLDSAPGSVSQVRACGNMLMQIGKSLNIPIFIVAHVTKTGDLAGPKVLEHLVDCVLHFSGERNQELRIMRAYKNRFGTVSEIGAFLMEEEGLIEVENLSKSFLQDLDKSQEGAIVAAVYEGTRPLLLEVQSLTAYTNMNFPRRNSIGIDINRLNMIIAVMEKKCKVSLINQDVYVNVVGGLKPEGTYMDLAVALAIYSSLNNKCPKDGLLAMGEISLTGSLRPVPHIDKIINEAIRMGFKRILLPKGNKKSIDKFKNQNIRIAAVSSLEEAIALAFE